MADPVSGLIAVALWLADKLTGGVVSDYAKKKGRKLLGLPNETDRLKKDLDDLQTKYSNILSSSNSLIAKIDDLSSEVVRLRLENAELRARLGEKPAGVTAPHSPTPPKPRAGPAT